jgi:rRNA maturation protein Nop10
MFQLVRRCDEYLIANGEYIETLKSVCSLCGLAVRVPSYRFRGPGFESWYYQIF